MSLTDTLDQAFFDFFVGNGLPFQITHHALVVGFYGGFYHLFMHVFRISFQVIRNLDLIGTVAVLAIGFHLYAVDDAFEFIFFAQRQFQGQYFLAEFMTQVFQDAVEVRVFAVHLVHQQNAGQTGFFRQLPALLGTYLYASGGIDYDQSAVYSPESAFYFRNEIGEARGIDKVDLAVAPFNRSQRSVYGYAAFNFFRFIVRGGSPIFYFAHTINRTSAVQQSFRYRCGSGPTVTYNGHISNFVACISFHE